MFDFRIEFRWPQEPQFVSAWEFFRLFGRHKAVECQVFRTPVVLGVVLHTSMWGEHPPGIKVTLSFLTWAFEAQFYDGCHWDYDNNKWADPRTETIA